MCPTPPAGPFSQSLSQPPSRFSRSELFPSSLPWFPGKSRCLGPAPAFLSQMFPLPPGRVCAPRPGTLPRGRGSPRASTSGGGGVTPAPSNIPGGLVPLASSRGCHLLFGVHCTPVNPEKFGIRGCEGLGSPGALQEEHPWLVVASLGTVPFQLGDSRRGSGWSEGQLAQPDPCQEVLGPLSGSGMFDPSWEQQPAPPGVGPRKPIPDARQERARGGGSRAAAPGD